MLLVGRTWQSASIYKNGFQGQEKVDEISGIGNHYTAEYWEMNSRTGRRWNQDPVRVDWESPYTVNRNSPISLNDPKGDCPDCPDGNYNIQEGDTYWDLENQWGLDHGTLESLNPGVNPQTLQVGQTIIANTDIPKSETQTYTSSNVTTNETQYQTKTVSTSTNASAPLLAAGAVLLADDATVIGVGDDPLLILIGIGLIGTLIYDGVNSGTETITIPVSIPSTINVKTPDPFWYVTYYKINPSTGKVYVGRASGYGATPQQVVNSRDVGHHMNALGYGSAILSTYATATILGGYATRALDPAYWSIRGSEQLQIEAYKKLGISGNTYNGVSPTNPNLQKYLDAAKKVNTVK